MEPENNKTEIEKQVKELEKENEALEICSKVLKELLIKEIKKGCSKNSPSSIYITQPDPKVL